MQYPSNQFYDVYLHSAHMDSEMEGGSDYLLSFPVSTPQLFHMSIQPYNMQMKILTSWEARIILTQ